jgi:hypothetical protein
MTDLRVHPENSPQIGSVAPISTSVPPPRLVSAAHEFEADLMKELMTPLEPGHDPLGGDQEDSSSALSSFAGEALGKALSEHGGLGIAKSILHQLSSEGNRSTHPNGPQV